MDILLVKIIFDKLLRIWDHFIWRLLGLRPCPRCKLTWEKPAQMKRYQEGLCHDCYGNDVT